MKEQSGYPHYIYSLDRTPLPVPVGEFSNHSRRVETGRHLCFALKVGEMVEALLMAGLKLPIHPTRKAGSSASKMKALGSQSHEPERTLSCLSFCLMELATLSANP